MVKNVLCVATYGPARPRPLAKFPPGVYKSVRNEVHVLHTNVRNIMFASKHVQIVFATHGGLANIARGLN